jgi:hypothetical protein
MDLKLADPLYLLAATETPAGGKAVAVADQSVFANQMLFFDDNAKLAMNVVAWLREPDRTTVLILDERRVIAPPSPADVEVELPPPTPEEVMEALRKLPPEVLVDFGNAVAATVEEENIPNELIAYLMERIPARHYARFLLLLPTVLLALVVTRRLFSDAAYDGAAPEPGEVGRRKARDRPARERQQAARELLERFRAEAAASSDVPWKVFASRLQIGGRLRATRRLRRALVKASRRLEPESHRYWTRRRLTTLETNLREWRRLRESGTLEYRAGR